MSHKERQNESHDWLADAAESLVRYYFADRGYFVYGAGKWGADCVIQDKKTGKMLTVEVKSSNNEGNDERIHARLVRGLEKKLTKIEVVKVRPDKYAEVRLKRVKTDPNRYDISIEIYDIDKAKKTIVDPARVLKTQKTQK